MHCHDPAASQGEVLIARKQQFFLLDITGLNTAAIEAELAAIVTRADAAEAEAKVAHPSLGVLSAWNRDDWCTARSTLIETDSSGVNLSNMAKIERSLFLICLDDDCPSSNTEAGRLALNGAANRYYDKTLQVVRTCAFTIFMKAGAYAATFNHRDARRFCV